MIKNTQDLPINDPGIKSEFDKSLMTDRKPAQTERGREPEVGKIHQSPKVKKGGLESEASVERLGDFITDGSYIPKDTSNFLDD